MRLGVFRAVAMALHRYQANHSLAVLGAQFILGEISRGEKSEGAGPAQSLRPYDAPAGAWEGDIAQPRPARVLQLFESQSQHNIIHPGSYSISRIPHSVGAGGAHILYPGNRYVVEFQRLGESPACVAGEHSPDPRSLNILLLHSSILKGFQSRLDYHILRAGIPPLAEFGATHAHYCNFILNALHLNSFSTIEILEPYGSALPPVAVNPAHVVHPSESHIHRHVGHDLAWLAVGHIAGHYPAAFEVDHRHCNRRYLGDSQIVIGEAGEL